MQILFVDESGTPPAGTHRDPKYFVLAGVVVSEDAWHRIRDSLFGMKIRRKIRGELKWRYFAPQNKDTLNPMRSIDQPTRDSIREEIYGIIGHEHAVKIIGVICSAAAAYKMSSVNNAQDVYNLTYKCLTERFQYYLQDLSRETGRSEYGLIIGDHRGRDDDRQLRAHHQMLGPRPI